MRFKSMANAKFIPSAFISICMCLFTVPRAYGSTSNIINVLFAAWMEWASQIYARLCVTRSRCTLTHTHIHARLTMIWLRMSHIQIDNAAYPRSLPSICKWLLFRWMCVWFFPSTVINRWAKHILPLFGYDLYHHCNIRLWNVWEEKRYSNWKPHKIHISCFVPFNVECSKQMTKTHRNLVCQIIGNSYTYKKQEWLAFSTFCFNAPLDKFSARCRNARQINKHNY